MFVDSHFHLLEMHRKGMNISVLMQGAVEAGFEAGLDIGILPEDFKKRKELLQTIIKDAPGTSPTPISLTAGIYPGGSETDQIDTLLDELELILGTGEASALGEIGLDYHWNYATPEKQKDLFRTQMDLANRYKLPVIIHSRNADNDMIEALQTSPPLYGGIMHCFSSGYKTAAACLDAGLCISFAGNVTYKNTDDIREAAIKIPSDRLLVETDAPYLSPHPVRGRKNHPAQIVHIYEFLSALRSVELNDFMKQAAENFYSLFSST